MAEETEAFAFEASASAADAPVACALGAFVGF